MGPRGTAFRMPWHFIPTRCVGQRPVGLPGACLGQAGAFLPGRAEPAPPRGGQAKARRPYGGKPGDGAKGGFLGGTHSVRPRIRAGRKPKHDTIIGGKRTRGGLMGQSPGGSEASCAGVRSPPLRGVDHPRARWPCGASPGITREVVFSEGRGLRARTARHHGWRKVSSMGEDRREAGGREGTCLGQASAFLSGRAEPAPPREAIQSEVASRGKARGWR